MGYGTNNMSLEMCLIVSYTHPHGGNFNKGNMMVNNWVLRGRSFWTEPVGFWAVSASSLEYFVSHLWDDGAWVDDIEYWMLISLATSWIFHHDGQPPYFSGDFNDPFMLRRRWHLVAHNGSVDRVRVSTTMQIPPAITLAYWRKASTGVLRAYWVGKMPVNAMRGKITIAAAQSQTNGDHAQVMKWGEDAMIWAGPVSGSSIPCAEIVTEVNP